MELTLCKRYPWIYALLALWLVKLSSQQTTPNGIEDPLQIITNLIINRSDMMDEKLAKMDAKLSQMDEMENRFFKIYTKMDEMDTKLTKMDARFSQMDEMKNKLSKWDARLSQMDAMDKKLSKMDAKLSQIDDIKAKVENIELKFETIGQKSSQSPMSIDEISSQGSAILEEMKRIKQETNLVDATLNNLTLSSNQMSKKMDSIFNEIKTQGMPIKQGFNLAQEGFSISNSSLNTPLRNIEIYSKIDNQSAELNAAINNLTLISNQLATELDTIVNEIQSQGTTIAEGVKLLKDFFSSSNSTLNTSSSSGIEIYREIDNQIVGLDQSFNISAMIINKTVEEETLLIFDPTELTLFVGQDAHLGCGVIGVYSSCQWEHSGLIYKLGDVRNGSHTDIMPASNSVLNQCGIVINSVNPTDDGVWICEVRTLEQNITASKNVTIEITELIFNPSDIYVGGKEAILECGVVGMYQTCQWEHNDLIYELAHIKNGSHSDLKAAPNSVNNQCGIVITPASTSHEGVWTCKVLAFGQTLTASTAITIGCPLGSFSSKGSNQCFVFFNDKKRKWDDAKNKCEEEGLMIAKPSDAVAITLRKDLLDTYGDGGVWLGARGEGYKFLWHDGTELKSDNPLWFQDEPGTDVTTGDCLGLLVWESNWSSDPDEPYASIPCDWSKYKFTLCEVIME